MKFIKIVRNGSGWGGIYHQYVCVPHENTVSVESINVLPSKGADKKYELAYNVLLRYLFDRVADCEYAPTGWGVMDAQNDIVIRVNDDNTEDEIYSTCGAVTMPADPEIGKSLTAFIEILSLLDQQLLGVDSDNKIRCCTLVPVNNYVWFNAKRCILANYCDDPLYAHTTHGPHCGNCLLKGMSSCRFLDHPRWKSHIDDEVVDRCYDSLMSYTEGE